MVLKDSFEIKLPQFEGPFDLLLFFIERQELDIKDVPIADIADEFLNYLHHLNKLNIELASEFIFTAATLMRIKAKMLLPRVDINEDGNEIDLQHDLIQKLIEYKKFKQISEKLSLLEDERFKQERRGNISNDLDGISLEMEPGEELSSISLYKLSIVYNKVVLRNQEIETEQRHLVVQYPYTIEKQKKIIVDLLALCKKLDFHGLNALSENKVQLVYNFLALLEMLQQQLISIHLGLGYNNFSIESKTSTND